MQNQSNKIFSYYDSSKEGVSTYLGFLLWPFGIMLASLKNWEKPWSKNIFWLFCVFFGWSFIIADVGGADSDRYATIFIQYAYSDLSLSELWSSFYAYGSNSFDIASPLITYIVSRFTDNPSVLFAVFAIFFGFFYSRNIWYLLEKKGAHFSLFGVMYLLTFLLFNPIWNINGFRMWTAAQIFLFGALPFIIDGNIKGLFWSVLSTFFHFSFIFPVAILFLFFVLRSRLHIYFAFFMLTSFIKEIDLVSIRTILISYLPSIFHSKVSSYTNERYVETLALMGETENWYMSLSSSGIQWVVYLSVITIYLFYKNKLKENAELNRLLCFSLLFYGFVNILSIIPSMDRFFQVANTFVFVFLIILYTKNMGDKGLHMIKLISMPFIVLFCIVTIWAGMGHFGLLTVLGNPLFSFFIDNSETLFELVKDILT